MGLDQVIDPFAEPLNLVSGLFKRTVVIDHEVGDGFLLGQGKLRPEPMIDLFVAEMIPLAKALSLVDFRGVHNNQGVQKPMGPGLDQKSGVVENPAMSSGKSLGGPVEHFLGDPGMGDRFELLPSVGVGEYFVGKGCTVEGSIGVENLVAEEGLDLGKGLGARGDDLSSELICVDDDHAEVAEKARDC